MNLDGKVAVVTGATGDIGLAAAQLFLQRGAKVMLVGRNEPKLQDIVSRAARDMAAYVIADVRVPAEVLNYAQQAVERFGKIDIFFNNAGIEGEVSPITDFSELVFDDVMAVNVRGAFLGMKYVLPRMRDGGSVVITSSTAGLHGTPNLTAYTTSKHALIGLMRGAAIEMRSRRIRVNTVHPGMVKGNMMERIQKNSATRTLDYSSKSESDRRFLAPVEVANMVLYLVSDESDMVTGATFVIDGGLTA